MHWSPSRPTREQVNVALVVLASEQYFLSNLNLSNTIQEEKGEVQSEQLEYRIEDAETGEEEYAFTYKLL